MGYTYTFKLQDKLASTHNLVNQNLIHVSLDKQNIMHGFWHSMHIKIFEDNYCLESHYSYDENYNGRHEGVISLTI